MGPRLSEGHGHVFLQVFVTCLVGNEQFLEYMEVTLTRYVRVTGIFVMRNDCLLKNVIGLMKY